VREGNSLSQPTNAEPGKAEPKKKQKSQKKIGARYVPRWTIYIGGEILAKKPKFYVEENADEELNRRGQTKEGGAGWCGPYQQKKRIDYYKKRPEPAWHFCGREKRGLDCHLLKNERPTKHLKGGTSMRRRNGASMFLKRNQLAGKRAPIRQNEKKKKRQLKVKNMQHALGEKSCAPGSEGECSSRVQKLTRGAYSRAPGGEGQGGGGPGGVGRDLHLGCSN